MKYEIDNLYDCRNMNVELRIYSFYMSLALGSIEGEANSHDGTCFSISDIASS